MMALAVLLSICSTVDAFIALGFVSIFSPGAILAFLIFGPMVDIKTTLMYLSVFKKRTVIYLILLPFLMSLSGRGIAQPGCGLRSYVMSLRLYRYSQSLLLIALGIFLTAKIVSGKLIWYIHPRFIPLTILAVIVLVLIGLVIFRAGNQTGQEKDNSNEEEPGHEHGPSAWRLAVIMLPLAIGVLIPAHPIDRFGCGRKRHQLGCPDHCRRQCDDPVWPSRPIRAIFFNGMSLLIPMPTLPLTWARKPT